MERTIVLEEYAKSRSRKVGLFKKYGTAILFLLPFMLAFIVFFIYPLIYGVHISLTNFTYSSPGTEKFNSFENFRFLLDKTYMKGKYYESFWRSFWQTIVFVIIMVPVAILLPLGLAVLINLKPPGYKFFRALIYMPSIVPLSASGCIFTLLFMQWEKNGLIDRLLNIKTNWITGVWFSYKLWGLEFKVGYVWIPIFLMCLWGGWGSNFIILCAGLENVPKNLYEACSIDGGSKRDRLKNITIPGIKGQLVLCLFTTIIGYFGLYGQNYVMTNGTPLKVSGLGQAPGGHAASTVIYYIQDIIANNSNFRESLFGVGAAASIIFAVVVGCVSGLQMFITREKKSGTKISEAYYKWDRIK